MIIISKSRELLPDYENKVSCIGQNINRVKDEPIDRVHPFLMSGCPTNISRELKEVFAWIFFSFI